MILFKRKTYANLFLLSLFCISGSLSFALHAGDEQWIAYKKYAELYEARLPANYQTEEHSILVGSGAKAVSQRIVAVVDRDATDGSDKTFTMTVSQTLGSPVYTEDLDKVLEEQLSKYLDQFVQHDGVLIERRIFDTVKNSKSGELHITYNDPARGPSHLRTRIHLSTVSRIEQSVLGNADTMHSYRTKGFFDSSILYDGYLGTKETVRDAWTPHVSPMRIFTAYLPEPDGEFVREKPKFLQSGRLEIMRAQFFDPFLKKTLTVNIYGYRLNKRELYDRDVVEVLQKQHLKKHYINVENGSFKKVAVNTIEVRYPLYPAKFNNFSDTGRLRARFDKNYLMVYEFWGPENIVNGSSFVNNIIDNIDFHPDKAYKLYMYQLHQAKNRNKETP